MAGSLASINIRFTADLKEFSTQMQNATRKLAKTGEAFKSVGGAMSTYITGPLLLAAGAAVKFASDYEESLNKVDVAFGTSSNSVQEFAKQTLKNFGIAEGSALEMASLFGDMATSMGLPEKAAADMSTSLVGLAGDLSSFKNIGIKEATTALNGIFTGETESLKRLGIVMTQANLQQFAYAEGINKTIAEMTEAEKVQLRYNYILSKTKNAQGDFARTGGGAANQMRIFQESLKQVAQQLGAVILPIFTKVITAINEKITSFSNLSDGTKKIIVIVAAVVAALGPLLVALGTIFTLLPGITAGLGAMGTAFTLMTGPIGLVIAGIAALIYVIYKNWDKVLNYLIETANYFIDLYNESMVFRAGVEMVILYFKNMYAQVKLVVNFIIDGFKAAGRNILSVFKSLGSAVKAVMTGNFKELPQIIANGFKESMANSKLFAKEVTEDFKGAAGEIQANIASALENTKNKKYKLITNDSVDKAGVAGVVEDAVEEGAAEGVVAGLAKGMANASKVIKVNTSAFFEKQISDLQELQKNLVDNNREWLIYEDRINAVKLKLEELQKPLQSLADLGLQPMTFNNEEFLDKVVKNSEAYKSMVTSIGEEGKRLQAEQDANNEAMKAKAEALNEAYQMIGEAFIGVFSSYTQGFVDSLNIADSGLKSFVSGIVGTITKLISMALSASIANSIQGATQTGTATGPAAAFTTPAFIATAIAGIIGAFASIPKFETGGIVGGNSYFGDKILARINSGELILNRDQQQGLYGMLNGGNNTNVSVGLELGTKISGSDIELIVNRAIAKNNRTR